MMTMDGVHVLYRSITAELVDIASGTNVGMYESYAVTLEIIFGALEASEEDTEKYKKIFFMEVKKRRTENNLLQKER